ncbi:MFS transporter [Deinococcus sp. PEB2-63]
MTAAAPAPLVPTAPVSWRFILPYTLATLAMWMAFNAPGQVLIGEQLISLDEGRKEANLALILGVGALISLLANPIFGALSDRARGRLGRRRPYLIGGAIAATAGLLLLGVGGSVPILVAGWGLTQLALNAYQAALTAVIPDRVPPSQRATVSGLAGLSRCSARSSAWASPGRCPSCSPGTRCWARCCSSPCWASS